MIEKSANVEHLNERLAQRTKELESSNNKIDILNRRVQELDNECATAETKAKDMNNMIHELNKAVQKMKDSFNKKEQVRDNISYIKNNEYINFNVSCVFFADFREEKSRD